VKQHVLLLGSKGMITIIQMKSSIFWDYNAMQRTESQLTFQMNPLHPSLGLKNKQFLLATCFHPGLLLVLFFDHEYGDMSLQNVG
jgi:hypothetical protein